MRHKRKKLQRPSRCVELTESLASPPRFTSHVCVHTTLLHAGVGEMDERTGAVDWSGYRDRTDRGMAHKPQNSGKHLLRLKAPAIDLFNLGRLRSVPFAARLHAPELKTVRIDCALNVFARKPVRRVLRPVALMTAIE